MIAAATALAVATSGTVAAPAYAQDLPPEIEAVVKEQPKGEDDLIGKIIGTALSSEMPEIAAGSSLGPIHRTEDGHGTLFGKKFYIDDFVLYHFLVNAAIVASIGIGGVELVKFLGNNGYIK